MAKKIKRPTLDELRASIPVVIQQNKAELIEEWYPCPDCGDLHVDVSDAADCCANTITEVYVCSLCAPKNGEMNTRDKKFVFAREEDAEKHLAEGHKTGDVVDPVQEYWDALRWNTKDPIQALSDLEMAQTRAKYCL